MFKNYVKVALRNFIRDKAHSVINITGLSVGMAVAILIGLWIHDEMSFNQYHQNYKRMVQLTQNVTDNGIVNTYTVFPFPLAEVLRREYGSDFKYVVMTTGAEDHILTFGNKNLYKTGGWFEQQAPDLLDLTMIHGTRAALREPGSVLLSESVAKAYFGDGDPLNKIMKIDNDLEVKVTGVYRDLPQNSTFSDAGFIGAYQQIATAWKLNEIENPWRPNIFQIYAQLADHANLASVSAKIADVKMRYVHKEELYHKPQVFLQPMSRWHLYSEFKNGINTGGRIQYVWLFGLIGLFVLFLACINFMNLSTARSEKRAREVGVRKAMGSLRRQLVLQFFGESLLVACLAFVMALLLARLSLPFFNLVADKHLAVPWNSPLFWLAGLVFSLVTGLVAGSYPALYLSSFQPVKVLKGAFKAGRFSAVPRKTLIVLQFTVSVVLIICTIVVFRQIRFAKDRPIDG
jgi:putative ABC transport system permease protein